MSSTILITGANRGLGLALARELLHQGHHVVAAAREPQNSEELKQLEMVHTTAFTVAKMDVTSDDSVRGIADSLSREIGSLDVLVNNAAVFPEEGDESIRDIDLQYFRDAFETNVVGVVRVTRAFLPLLEQSPHPRVVNISSGASSISQKDDAGYFAYATSKAALNMVTRAMAAELKKICIVAVTPGWVQTDMGGPNAPLTPAQSAGAIAKTITGLTLAQSSRFLERTGEESRYAW